MGFIGTLAASLIAGLMTGAGSIVAAGSVGAVALSAMAPLLMLGFPVAESWPIVWAVPGQTVPAIIACATLGTASYLLKCSPAAPMGYRHLRAGHLCLLLIFFLALSNSLFTPTSVKSFILITSFASIPLALIGAFYSKPSVPHSWVLLFAGLPLLITVGIVPDAAVNPIAVGNVSWAAAYFAVVLRRRLPLAVVAAIVAAAVYQLATIDQLGPKIAAGACLLAATWQRRRRPSGSETNRKDARPESVTVRTLLLALGLVALTVGLAGAVQELGEGGVNNSTVRQQTWAQTLSDTSFTGHGVVNVISEVPGRDLALSNHNFVLDSLSSAGWVGLALMAYVLVQCRVALTASSHPLVPFCLGVAVANAVSGGLFRSPSLWFSLSFLIAEAARSSIQSPPKYRSGAIRSPAAHAPG